MEMVPPVKRVVMRGRVLDIGAMIVRIVTERGHLGLREVARLPAVSR